jgi:hypothetical protein
MSWALNVAVVAFSFIYARAFSIFHFPFSSPQPPNHHHAGNAKGAGRSLGDTRERTVPGGGVVNANKRPHGAASGERETKSNVTAAATNARCLHFQTEIENLKQAMADMEEKVQYQSDERLRDVNEVLENCQTRVSSTRV